MKTYKIKNYKGQLVESLERFTKKYKGMRVVEASEKDGALNIIAEEDDDYEICNRCGAEIDPCDALYVDPSEAYCSEECLEAQGYTLDDVIDDTELDEARSNKLMIKERSANGGINPDDYTSYANDFEAEVRKIVTNPEKVKNILTATDELASRDHVRSMLLDKFLKDDHNGFIQGFADLFGMSPDEHNEEDVKTAWNELVKAQPRAAIMYQLQGVGPEILDDVLEAAGFETEETLEEAEDAEGQAGQEAATADSFDDKFFKDLKKKAEDKLSIFSNLEPKFQHEISAKERKDILMKIRMAIFLLYDAAPYPEKGEQTKRKVASKINALHDKLLDLSNQVYDLTR